MGVATLPDGSGVVRVIAGEYRGVRGPAKTFTPVNLFDVRLSANGSAEFAFPARENAALLVMAGEVSVNGEAAGANDFVLFANRARPS